MYNKFEVPRVGDEIVIINDKYWDSFGIRENLYPIGSKWKVKRVIVDEDNPNGIVYCENNIYSVPHGIYKIIKKKQYRVDIKAQKYISGDFCEETYSDEEYDFSLEFYDEMSASNYIDEEEYYFDMSDNGHRYIICGKSKPIKINQENVE